MRLFRSLALAASAAVLTAAVATAPAAAATDGVGTAQTSTTVVDVRVGADGSVLTAGLLADEARATIDPAVSTPEAFARLLRVNLDTPLDAIDALVAGLPVLEARSPGGAPEVTVAGASVTLPPAGTSLPEGVIATATVDPLSLKAALPTGSAESSISAGVSGLSLAGGLIAAEGAKASLATSGTSSAAEATRSVSVGNVVVLDLGALLQGLGIELTDLPTSTVIALVDELGLVDAVSQLTGIPVEATLDATITTLNQSIDDLQEVVDGTATTIEQTTDDLLGLVGLDAPSLEPTTTQAQELIDDLQAVVTQLLAGSLLVLDSAALLELGGVEVGMTAKATDAVETSVARVTGTIGSIVVGGIELLPETDLVAGAANVATVVEQIETTVAGALGAVHPDLAALVDVSVLAFETSAPAKVGDYVKAAAGITAATATITPPSTLQDIVAAITGTADSIGAALEAEGINLDDLGLSSGMLDLQTVLTLGAGVLTSPSTVRVASVLSASEFRVPAGAVTPPGGELPRTGGVGGGLVLLAGLAAVLAVGLLRLVRTPAVRVVRKD